MLSGLDVALTIDSQQHNPFTVMNPPGPEMLILLERFLDGNKDVLVSVFPIQCEQIFLCESCQTVLKVSIV
jgi:hypothetical protein